MSYNNNFTAFSGSDYVHFFSAETFTRGSSNGATRCVVINIVDDAALEKNQTFYLALTTATSGVLQQKNTTVITIIDKDGKF